MLKLKGSTIKIKIKLLLKKTRRRRRGRKRRRRKRRSSLLRHSIAPRLSLLRTRRMKLRSRLKFQLNLSLMPLRIMLI